MASQNKPPASERPEGRGGSSVRRAVSLGSAAADPGPMLAPAARRAPEPGQDGAEGAERARSAPTAPDAAESEAGPEAPATTGEPAASAGASAGSAPGERSEAESESAAGPATGVRAVADAEARGVGGTAVDSAAVDGAGADGPPSGNPKKPLLAAAGIAGVVLLAVPLLIWATDDSRQKKDHVAVANGSDTLLEEDPLEVPKGDYSPAAPTPRPSTGKPSAKPSAKPSPAVHKAETVPSPAPTSEPAGTPKKAANPVKENTAPKLPPNTAAYAVQRLAASNPGRHICYRVHVKGVGWTDPVCDGATAGQEGKGRPITAINIAVADAKKVNGNEFVQKDGWTTGWSGAVDGTDLVLGSAASNAPNLSGFTIGVDSGTACQNHKLGGHDWGGLACESSQGWIFGGSTEPQYWLEAVRFTV
ncbi:hypothetical protein [Streptomyces sp. H51]|uniref:hypothetical protein n=1 Tax=Streptomyces sp. H51 TaxID=3111770 RepID=UPI002D77D3F2|nr:hypothetical protein [Streptomyces sp. H51]